jgi:hypothetical protein
MNINKKKFVSSKEFYNLPVESIVTVLNKLDEKTQLSGLKSIIKKRDQEYLFNLYLSKELHIEDRVIMSSIDYCLESKMSDRKLILLIRMVNELVFGDIYNLVVYLLSEKKYKIIKEEIFFHTNFRSRTNSIPEEKYIEIIAKYIFKKEHREIILFLSDKEDLLREIFAHCGMLKEKYKELINKTTKEEYIINKVKYF